MFELVVIVLTVPLITHLVYAISGGSLHQQFGFVESASQGLFDIDMLAQGHGEHGEGERSRACPQ